MTQCGRRRLAIVGLMGLLLAAAGCSYRGGIDNPAVRRAGWFSYLDGGDIRAACTEGALDQYRLVYNGRYQEQLRSYEITADGAGGAYLVARAMGRRPNLARVSLNDIMAPWRWRKSQARLTPAALEQLVAKLEASGMFAGAPVGLRLFSGGFYWVASGCWDGVFHFNAWLYPSARFDRLSFPAFLLAHDETGLPFNPPRRISPGDRLGPRGTREDQARTRFWLQVRENGLGGLLNAF